MKITLFSNNVHKEATTTQGRETSINQTTLGPDPLQSVPTQTKKLC